MTTTLLEPDALVTEAGVLVGAAVRIRDGRVLEVGDLEPAPGEPRQRVAGTLLPGLVDLQVNGAAGHSCADGSAEALDAVARACWRGGAAAFLPTLVTAPFPRLLAQTRSVAEWIARAPADAAQPLGIHLEGPFLEASGVHDASCFVDPTPERIDALLEAARGQLRLVTLAPARPAAAAATARLRAHGVTVAIGHAADPAHLAACVQAGATLVTHLFNAMGRMHHREPGIAGLALDEPRLSASLIVDGAHVHPAMLRNAWRCLASARTVLVTDAVAAAGMPDGEYELGGRKVRLHDGVVRDPEGRLAGSALTMARAAMNFARAVPDAGPWTLARIAAWNPAQLIGAREHGAIARGMRAAFCVREADGNIRPL